MAASFATLLVSSAVLHAEEKDSTRGFSKREKKGLLETSIILHSRGKLALVPKGSIIVLPKDLESKIATNTTKGKLVSWKKFLSANGSWIHMFPVSFDQAIGKATITLEQQKSLRQLNKLVIARRGTNLVSVSPKAMETEETEKKSSL